MTITNLLTGAARADAQDARELQARVEALLMFGKPQTFTAPPSPPEPRRLEETEEPERQTAAVEVVYHHDHKCSTGDLVGGHFVGPMAGT